MTRPWRIVSVALGLIGVGAVLGAVAGAVAVYLSLWITRDPLFAGSWIIGAVFGAPPGAALAPILGLLMLRNVPLGRMFAGLTVGTVIGGTVGWITSYGGTTDEALVGYLGAFIGCVVAAVILRHASAHYASRRLHRSPIRRESGRSLHSSQSS